MTNFCIFHKQHILLMLHVQPAAKTTAWAGLYGERLKVRLAAPPTDGLANRALCDWLAQELNVSPRDVSILRGAHSRAKTIRINIDANQHAPIKQMLLAQINPTPQ
ncbi:MAG: DUF167 domain-containing protein [Formosimonas sp.]